MSGPALLLVSPLIGAFVVYLIRRWKVASIVAGAALSWILAVGLLTLNFSYEENPLLSGTWTLFEQPVTLRDQYLLPLAFVFLVMGFVYLLSWIAPQDELFIPISLLGMTPLLATLMIEPFQNGAVMLLLAGGLVAILIQGKKPGSTLNSIRYLNLSMLAVPLLVTAGWLLETRQAQYLSLAAYFLLFAILILILSFPFHIWVGPIVTRSNSLVPTVIFGLYQLIIVIFTLHILLENPVIYGNAWFLETFRISGAVTLLLAMLLVVTTKSVGHLLGYLILMDIGVTILSLALGGRIGLELTVILLILRTIGLVALGVGFGLLHLELEPRSSRSISFESVAGQVYRTPYRIALMIFGALSLTGAPLTPGFIGRWQLIKVSYDQSPIVEVIIIASVVTGLIGIARLLVTMFTQAPVEPEVRVSGWHYGKVIIILLIVIGLLISLFPEQILAVTAQIAQFV
jgi:formate hydrogenlyase subunit 3/multisubunit Na+/H+ antiporter MnhD subunit